MVERTTTRCRCGDLSDRPLSKSCPQCNPPTDLQPTQPMQPNPSNPAPAAVRSILRQTIKSLNYTATWKCPDKQHFQHCLPLAAQTNHLLTHSSRGRPSCVLMKPLMINVLAINSTRPILEANPPRQRSWLNQINQPRPPAHSILRRTTKFLGWLVFLFLLVLDKCYNYSSLEWHK